MDQLESNFAEMMVMSCSTTIPHFILILQKSLTSSLTILVSNWLKVLICYFKTSNQNELLVNTNNVCDFYYKTHFVLIRENMTPMGI